MPGVRAQNAQPKQPFGPQLKAALIQAAPLFSAMAAGYSSGRGPYAYLDQGIAGMQAMQKQKRDEEAAAAAAAAFGGLVPGGMGPAGAPASATSGRGGAAPITFDKAAPQYIADDAMAALGKEPLSMEGRIREGLKARGLPEHIANGFIANFKDESNLNPGINEAAPVVPGSRGGFGLAQWTGPRRKALEAFAASQGKPVDDLDVQLDFLMTELSGSEAGAGAAIMSAKNAPEAAAAIVNNFLRPAEQHRASREAEYLGMDAGAPTQADPLADPYVQKLMKVMAMPGLSPERRSVVELMLQTRMGQLTAPNPDADEDRARQRRARDAELLGYGRGTPEWTQYVVTGEQPKPAEKAKPYTDLGQINADLAAGLITPEQAQTATETLNKKGGGMSYTVQNPDGSSTTFQLGGDAGLTSANTTDANKSIMAYDSLTKGLDEYEAIFNKTGGAVVPGVDKDALLTARRGLQLQMKELFNLGVLNGPDLEIMDAMLVDPTSITNNTLDALGVSPLGDRVTKNLAQLRTMFEQMVKPKIDALRGTAPAVTPITPAPSASGGTGGTTSGGLKWSVAP